MQEGIDFPVKQSDMETKGKAGKALHNRMCLGSEHRAVESGLFKGMN